MVTGWYQLYSSTWYYFEASGAAAQGWLKINNKWYYFDDGYMYSGGSYKCADGKRYLFKESGEWVKASGWYQLKYEGSSQGTWYYLESDGTVRTNGWNKINGAWYYLSTSGGNMYQDGSYVIDENGTQVAYLFDASGAWINKTGWYKYTEIAWYYYDTAIGQANWYYMTNGRLNTGIQTIGGKKYYFSPSGIMYSGIYFTAEDGTRYFAADSGELSKVTSQGWKKGTWSYIVNGKSKTFTQWYYFGANGAEYTGWLKSGSSWYYLYESEAITNRSYSVNGTIYVFDANGVLCENRAGWIACPGVVDTTWYYVDAKGVAYNGWKSIGGKWYYFDLYSGSMYQDEVYYIDDDTYYGFNSSGAMVTGWFKSSYSNSWWYFDSNGKGHTGWVKSGSTWYYTNEGRTYTDGTYTINGKKCKFDASGKWLGYV